MNISIRIKRPVESTGNCVHCGAQLFWSPDEMLLTEVIEVTVSPDAMAKAYIEGGSDEQGKFINLIGKHFRSADFNAEFQICSIADDINENGRYFIFTLANFLKARGVPCSSPKKGILLNYYPDEEEEMILCYTLSMPQVGSWNGKWTRKLYAIVNSFRGKKKEQEAAEIIMGSPYYYSFGDGWGAKVSVYEVDAKDAAKLRRKSEGFCGYDWMVRSIEKFGKIKPPSEWD